MRKPIKFITVLMMCVLLSGLCALSVFAETSSMIDGLKIEVSTDNSSYAASDDITVTVTVTNKNDKPVTNLSIETLIPEGYEQDESLIGKSSIDVLNPGEVFTVKAKMLSTVEVEVEPITDPETGGITEADTDSVAPGKDDGAIGILKILLIIVGVCSAVVIAAVIVIICKKVNKSTIAMFLCILMIGGTVTPALAMSNQSVLTISHSVAVGDGYVSFDALLMYDRVDGKEELLNIDTSNMMYDYTTDVYYLKDSMPVLSGSLSVTEGVESMHCVITDDNSNILLDKNITPNNLWSLEDVGMIVGMNHINLSVSYKDGFSYEKNYTINNVCPENMNKLSVDKGDTDDDGVLNFIELMYHTNPNLPDTDADGLTDYYEMAILGTDPKLVDSDSNSVSDADEDADGDGLTNTEEINQFHTAPDSVDSDGDGLSDYREIKELQTDPNLADTDADGRDDLWEIDNGYDPLTFNKDLPREDNEVIPENVEVVSEGEVYIAELPDHELVNEETPGYIGQDPLYIEISEGSSAEIKIEYNPLMLAEGDSPALFLFDEETQCYEMVESTVNENGTVSASVNKTGLYVLLNHRYIEDIWQNDIFKPSESVENGTIDMVFVIDRSMSMDDNDPQDIRKVVTKEFIEKLRVEFDRAAIVQFTAIAELIMPMTNDKEALYNAVDSIKNSDGGGCSGTDPTPGTNGSAGIRAALNCLADSTADYKYIIFLTDGADTEVAEDYGDELGTYGLTGEAKAKGVVIHTVGLVGNSGVDVPLLQAIAKGTGGNYYLATVGAEAENDSELFEIYDKIESVTIDRQLDSNNDGISDYYTKLICEGQLTTGTGRGNLFGSALYEQIQENADYDGDGIINGDELVIIEKENGVFVKLVSLPYDKDSDNDGMEDPYEYLSGLSPMKKNAYAEIADIDWITNSENFMADAYLDIYNSSAFERGSVLIGNAFFGTTLDQTILYRQMLINYFAEMDKTLMSSAQVQNYRALMGAYIDESFTQITNHIIGVAESGNQEEYDSQIKKYVDFVKGIQENFDMLDKMGVDEVLTKLVNFNATMKLGECKEMLETIKENMKHIPSVVTPETRDSWGNYMEYLGKRLIDYTDDSKMLTEKIELRAGKIKGFTKVVDKVGDALMVIEWGFNAWDAYLSFCDINASLATLEDNAYILDCIIATTDNYYLRQAARDLKMYINQYFSEQTRDFIMAMDQAEGVVTKVALDLIHGKIIAAAGVPGAIIELVRVIGNVVFDMDKISKAAAETVALAASADILGTNYKNHLIAGYAESYEDRWIGYADYSHDMYISMLNLSLLRKMAELKLKEWQDDQTLKDMCQNNSDTCAEKINKYNDRYLSFYTD